MESGGDYLSFLNMVVHSCQLTISFVMTQEEIEMWVYKHLSPVEFELCIFQGQARFYEQVLALWQIPQEKCSPKEPSNLIPLSGY